MTFHHTSLAELREILSAYLSSKYNCDETLVIELLEQGDGRVELVDTVNIKAPLGLPVERDELCEQLDRILSEGPGDPLAGNTAVADFRRRHRATAAMYLAALPYPADRIADEVMRRKGDGWDEDRVIEFADALERNWRDRASSALPRDEDHWWAGDPASDVARWVAAKQELIWIDALDWALEECDGA